MSPKSEHSVWAASSSDPDLGSLATRLRTTASANFSQDGLGMLLRCATFAAICDYNRLYLHVHSNSMLNLFVSVLGC